MQASGAVGTAAIQVSNDIKHFLNLSSSVFSWQVFSTLSPGCPRTGWKWWNYVKVRSQTGARFEVLLLSTQLNWAEQRIFFLHTIQVLYTHLIFSFKVEMDEIIREQLKWSLMTSSCLIIVWETHIAWFKSSLLLWRKRCWQV